MSVTHEVTGSSLIQSTQCGNNSVVRDFKLRVRVSVHNDKEQLCIDPELYYEYISKGYVHGRFSNKQK